MQILNARFWFRLAILGSLLVSPISGRCAVLNSSFRSIYVDTTDNSSSRTTPGFFVASKMSGNGETTSADQDSTLTVTASGL